MKRVVIVGGGITGLAAAYYLQKEARDNGLPLSFWLVEAAPHLGGKIITERQDGFVIEGGPDAFLGHKPWAFDLARELDLGEALLPSNAAQHKTSIVKNGRLVELPAGLQQLVPTRIWPWLRSPILSWSGKLRMGLEPLVAPRLAEGDESLANFIRRRMGEEALARLGEPLLAHIHAADAERMSLLATYPQFRALEQSAGSLWRGVREAGRQKAAAGPVFWTLREGMADLVEALASQLPATSRILGRRVLTIARTGETPAYAVRLKDHTVLLADAIVLATPAAATAQIVRDLNPQLVGGLEAIRYVSLLTLSLGFRRSELKRPIDGFGFLVPRCEGRQILACTFTSSKFPERAASDQVLLRVFLGGAWQEELLEQDDEQLVALVTRELQSLLKFKARPWLWRLYRFPKGYPQYDVGHLERVNALYQTLPPGLFLAGSAYEGVGLPDCIHSGSRVARKTLAYLADPGSLAR